MFVFVNISSLKNLKPEVWHEQYLAPYIRKGIVQLAGHARVQSQETCTRALPFRLPAFFFWKAWLLLIVFVIAAVATATAFPHCYYGDDFRMFVHATV